MEENIFWSASSLRFTAMPQDIQIINDDADNRSDDGLWVLFVGNPANVTTGGVLISGMRNLALPTGTIKTAQAKPSTVPATATVQSDLYNNKKNSEIPGPIPTPVFPLLFTSGKNAGTQVQVTAFDPGSGTFTVQKDPTLGSDAVWPLNAQSTGDQFRIGAYSQKLSSLSKAGTIPSSLSGKSPNVYSVTAEDIASGVLYISYQQITYLDAAPSIASSKFAFQTVELTTAASGQTGNTTSDLTVIDYFGIPIQIESVCKSGGSVNGRRTFYFNKSAIESGITSLGATRLSSGMYLGPGQQAAANKGNPSPFPSFADYLQSLTGKSFNIEGKQNFGTANPLFVYGIKVAQNYNTTYGYVASVTAAGSGDYQVTMTPISGENTIAPAPGSSDSASNLNYFPDPDNVDNITVDLPGDASGKAATLDDIIYGAILNADSFSINLKSGSASLTPTTLSGPFTDKGRLPDHGASGKSDQRTAANSNNADGWDDWTVLESGSGRQLHSNDITECSCQPNFSR